MTTLAFLDTESTGLDPDRHEIWEVALIRRDDEGVEVEHVWQLPVDLGRADPMALDIGRYHERRMEPAAIELWAETFVDLTAGAHLVGAVVSFDADRLWRLLRRLGQCPMWHYHLIDIEALAAGFAIADARRCEEDFERRQADPTVSALMKIEGIYSGPWRREAAAPPWDSDDLSRVVGVDPDQFDRHTALGDARWARAIYDTVMA